VITLVREMSDGNGGWKILEIGTLQTTIRPQKGDKVILLGNVWEISGSGFYHTTDGEANLYMFVQPVRGTHGKPERWEVT
jgi:hypothetical protein